jgi:hypothetical protein
MAARKMVGEVADKGRNRAEDDQFGGRGGGGHENFESAGLLGFLHRVQKGLSAGKKKSVDAGADQKKREVLDAIGSKAGTDGAGEKIKCGEFGEDSDEGNDEAATVTDCGEQVAPEDGVELVESGRHRIL